MPIFEFHCNGCELSFEEICAADAEAPACPACGSGDVEKRVSMPSPLKKGAFPFKPGPVHPLGRGSSAGLRGASPCGSCASGASCAGQ